MRQLVRQLHGDDHLEQNFSRETLYRMIKKHVREWGFGEKGESDILDEFKTFIIRGQKQWDIVIPIEGIQFDEDLRKEDMSLDIADCILTTFPDEFEVAVYELGRKGGMDEDLIRDLYLGRFLDSAVFRSKGIAACEPRRAVEKSRISASKSLKILSFWKDQAWLFGGHAPPLALRDTAMALDQDGRLELISGETTDPPFFIVRAGLDRLSSVWKQWDIDKTKDLVVSTTEDGFTATMRAALSLISKADNEVNLVHRVLWYVIALEQMVTSDHTIESGTRQQLNRALLLLLGASPEDDLGQALYDKRSRIAHGSDLEVAEKEEKEAREGAKLTFLYLQDNQDILFTKSDIVIFIDMIENWMSIIYSEANIINRSELLERTLSHLRTVGLVDKDRHRLTELGAESHAKLLEKRR